MQSKPKKQTREEKLRSALRDNLKKRKLQARKFRDDDEQNSVSLRERDIAINKDDDDKS